ncbi:MAG: effector binding domain-containing protein [Rhizomicrobium sp.]|nr:effector binding domain-containing protein [Rhizomicrobium sp.]
MPNRGFFTVLLEQFGPIVLAGLSRRHIQSLDPEVMYGRISTQWREFAESAHVIPALPPRLGYGIGLAIDRGTKTMDYFCGFVVPSPERVPEGISCLALPLLRCAVFAHQGHVSRILFTLEAIFSSVLPREGLRPAVGGPSFIQRYGESFDPDTGLGGMDILIPVA